MFRPVKLCIRKWKVARNSKMEVRRYVKLLTPKEIIILTPKDIVILRLKEIIIVLKKVRTSSGINWSTKYRAIILLTSRSSNFPILSTKAPATQCRMRLQLKINLTRLTTL